MKGQDKTECEGTLYHQHVNENDLSDHKPISSDNQYDKTSCEGT